jgi:hypothetical protein
VRTGSSAQAAIAMLAPDLGQVREQPVNDNVMLRNGFLFFV